MRAVASVLPSLAAAHLRQHRGVLCRRICILKEQIKGIIIICAVSSTTSVQRRDLCPYLHGLRPHLCCQRRSSAATWSRSSAAASTLCGVFDRICAETLALDASWGVGRGISGAQGVISVASVLPPSLAAISALCSVFDSTCAVFFS